MHLINVFTSLKPKKFLFGKKLRYLFLSILFTIILFVSNRFIVTPLTLYIVVFIPISIIVMSVFYVHYMDKSKTYVVFSLILPVHLTIGYYFSFYYFPNLGPLVRIIAYISFALIVYVLFLINNIFLVIKEKGDLIPLYSAAVTWVQILITTIAIPYLSGIYKTPVNFVIQSLIILGSTFLFNFYMIWVTYLDSDIKRTPWKERGLLSLMLAFLTFSFSLGIAFFPAESFLRALFLSTLIMFGLVYIHAHYKNRINLRLLIEYALISAAFFVILIIFNP